LEEVEVEVEA